MTSILVLLAASQSLLVQTDKLLNLQIAESDIVCVARYERAGQYEAHVFYSPTGEALPDPIWIHRYRLFPLLTLKGQSRPEVVVLTATSSRGTPGGFGRWEPWGDHTIPAPEGSLVLAFAYKPPASQRIARSSTEYYFLAENTDQFYYGAIRIQYPTLPEGGYRTIGTTPVERYVGILAQAYAFDPQKNVWHLRLIRSVMPFWRTVDGQYALTLGEERQRQDNPQIDVFYREKIDPLLLQAAGGDIVQRLRVMYTGAVVGATRDRTPEYQQLVSRLEAEWPDPQAEGLLEGLLGDQEYTLSKLESRLSSVRAQATLKLRLDGGNISIVLSKLTGDPSWEVKAAAAQWFNHLRDLSQSPYRDAPRCQIGDREIRNLAEVVQYWSAR